MIVDKMCLFLSHNMLHKATGDVIYVGSCRKMAEWLKTFDLAHDYPRLYVRVFHELREFFTPCSHDVPQYLFTD